MKFKTFRRVLISVVAALLLVGLVGAIWISARSSPPQAVGNAEANPETVMFVPRQAPLMASLLVNAEQLRDFGLESLPPAQRRQVRSDLDSLRRQIEDRLGLNYETDLFPWSGSELTLALTTLDIDRDPVNGFQPGYLLAIAVWDVEKAEDSLQRLWREQSGSVDRLVTETYSGVKLVYPDSVDSSSGQFSGQSSGRFSARVGLASAQVGDAYVLFANSPEVIRSAINNVQVASLNLGHSPLYQEALDQLPNKRFGLVWMNWPQLEKWFALADASAVAAGGAAERPESEAVAMTSLAIAPAGVVADTVLMPSLAVPWLAAQPSPPSEALEEQAENPALRSLASLSRYIPTDSSLALVSRDLQSLWDALVAADEAGDRLAHQMVSPVLTHQEDWQIDLSETIFPWAQGSFALAQVATSASTPDWLFVTESSEAAQTGIKGLDAIAQSRGFSVGPLQMGEQMPLIWTRLKAVLKLDDPTAPVSLLTDVRGIHASVDSYEILSTSVGALGKAILSEDYTLSQSPAFQRAMDALELEDDGYLYATWPTAKTLLAEASPVLNRLLTESAPLLSGVRSLIVHPQRHEAGVQRLEAVLQFQSDSSES